MRRTQRLLALALVLALLAPCFGVAVAEDAEEPAAAKDVYEYDGVTYYKVERKDAQGKDKEELEESPEHYFLDLMGNQRKNKEESKTAPIGNLSMGQLWSALGWACVNSNGDLFKASGRTDHVLNNIKAALENGYSNVTVTDNEYLDTCYVGPVFRNSIEDAHDELCNQINSRLSGKPVHASVYPAMVYDSRYPDEAVRTAQQPVIAAAIHSEGKWSRAVWNPPAQGYLAYDVLDYRGAFAYFTDFKVVALLPDSRDSDGKAYVRTIDSEDPPESRIEASNVQNLTLSPVVTTQSVSESWSTSVSSSVSHSESYSFSEGISLGLPFEFLASLFTTGLNFTATQIFTDSWSESVTKNQSDAVTRSVTVALPPYTNVLLKHVNGRTHATTSYNCPIGLKFTVRIVGYVFKDKDNQAPSTAQMEQQHEIKYYTFGADARDDLYKRAVLNGDLNAEKDAGYSNAVNWNAVKEIKDSWSEFSGWKCVEAASRFVPFSSTKAKFTETLNTMNTTVSDIVAKKPLRMVKLEAPDMSFVNEKPVSYGNLNYLHADMKVGDASFTNLLKLSGQNEMGADYYGFNPIWGTWKVVDKDGNELTGDTAPVELELQDKVSGNTQFIAKRPGTCYLKYFIDERTYLEDAIAHAEDPDHYDLNSLEEGKGYTTNDKLIRAAALEITVTENDISPTHTIEVTGSYTGEVRKAPEKLDENGLVVSIRDESGKEIEENYTWEAQELPAKGISLDADGTVKFTKPGTFHVRAVCQAHSIMSDWVEITATEKGLARIVTPPTPRDGLYDGQEQALLIPGEVEGGTMVYSLDTDGTNENFTEVGKVFSADIPTASQAGTYKIWYKALGDANHIDSQVSYLIVTVLKSPVQPVKPDSDALVYNGEAQALVKAGSVAGGTLQYFLGDKAPEKDGDWSADIPTGTDAGEYTVWYRVKGDKNHNDSEPASLKVTIEKRPLVVTPNDAAKTFGDADPVLTWTADGLVGSDSLLGELERTKGENVGTYAITQGSLAASDNYAPVFNEGLFTIKPKKITVKAKDATAVYGKADPKFKYTVTGLVGKDKLTGMLSRKDGVDVGKYPITQGTLTASGNYTISFEGAVFTITKRPVTVKAKATSKHYGDADPELEYIVKGLVEPGQLTGKLVRKAGEKVGAYAIGKGSLSVGKNYKLTFKGAKFTVKPRTVTVTAKDASKVAGSADPKLTYTVDGLVNGDKLKGKLSREVGEAPGSYAITQGTLRASKNYAISFNGASLTITAREKLPVAPDYTLLAKMRSENDSTIFFSWSKVDGAVGYDVFFKDCDGDQDYSLYKTVMGMNCRIEGLKKGSCHKGFVRAWTNKNGNKAYIGNASPTVHCIVGGSDKEHTNAESVKLNKTRLTLVKGKTSNLKVEVKGEVSGKKMLDHIRTIRFYSSNANVAMVNRYGKVTAVEGGVCTIYAMANDGVRASVKVKVVASPEKISFAKSSYSVKRGKTLKLAKQVKLSPAGLQSALGWASSDPSIATVSANGVVKGVKKGSVTITAVADNGKKAKVTVKVK